MARSWRMTQDADDDLAGIDAYVAGYAGDESADRLADEFLAAFDELAAHPEQHLAYPFPEDGPTLLHEYRSVNVRGFKVFHWVDGDEIEIYRIRHVVSDFTRIGF